ncbi:hypothetical protein [Olleya sp. Hel_I_94]|jgi:hypothetical protein|uniref:hypothetical protein n=1 Tax=Olleya sp. Hel_I_94 TaxID=1250001 RepID=UPI00119EF50E|nr:hypothetical protein [Olleya sp. Hel_I_94]TVZ47444.1 hypothetical protein JM82_2051 [Olleya sp. Hel_I_94]
MKIKELKNIFSELVQELTFEYKENPNNVTLFKQLVGLRKAMNKLETTGLLTDEVKEFRSSAIFTTNKDNISLNTSEARQLKTKLDNLIRLVGSLNTSFKEIGGEVNENSISIKLPEVTDFEDLSKFSSDFHKILNQAIVNDEINGQVRIDSVENGSIWLDVYLGSTAAVTLIGSLTWSAAVIYKKIKEGQLIEQHVKSLKIKNDSLKEIQEKQKQALDLMIEAEAQSLYNESFDGDNNEQIERLKLSVKMLSNLIEKGAEIHPALNQPEKVTNLFPDMKKLNSIESRIKKLEE